jgi:beta-lactamase class A
MIVKSRIGVMVATAACLVSSLATAQTDASLERLERAIERGGTVAGGLVGATAIHLETGRTVSVNGDVAFPMASTYKVPIAIELLTRADAGTLALDEMLDVTAADLHPGSGTLSPLLAQPGVSLSIRNLMELMLRINDNSATDMLLARAGGSEVVTARMRALGIDGIRVDRPTALLIADRYGAVLPAPETWTLDVFDEAFSARSEDERAASAIEFDLDPRDTATPNAFAELLARLHRGELVSEGSTALLLDIMERCLTGENRLKGLLPADTVVAHKTGSLAGTANDVGIMTLPDSAGHVAIAVLMKSSDRSGTDRARAIAEIARAVYDYFLFAPN